MIEINLISGGDSSRRSSRKRKSVGGGGGSRFKLPGNARALGLGAGVGLIVLLFVLSFWRTGAEMRELDARIESETADSVRLASVILLLEEADARRDTVEQKIGIIRDVDARRYVWPHIMEEVSRAMPEFTWLTGLRANGSGAIERPAFTAEGHVGSTRALTRFMTQLENSPFIRSIDLVTSEQVTEEGRTFQRFALEGSYRTPEPMFVETVPVVVPD